MSATFADRLPRLAGDAGLFLHQLDVAGDRALLVAVESHELRRASFVDERLLAGARRDGGWIALADVLARAEPLAGRLPDAIFHIGHCGSTLVSRLLDHWPEVLGLREPLPLRTLAELHETLGTPTARWSTVQWGHAFDRVLGLLDRRFPGQRRVLVKATSSCNGLVAPWLERHPAARALLLHIPLQSWLATLLKSPDAVADAMRFAPARLAVLHARLGEDHLRLYEHGPGEVLALGWLAECARFAGIAAEPALAARVLRVDFERLLDDPTTTLAAIAAHFGLPADAARGAAACAAELGRYAKATEHPYSPADRAADLATAQHRFGAEIDAGRALAERLVARSPALAALQDAL